jgi:hypothetical protein
VSTNAIQLQPDGLHADRREPVVSAVGEVSARLVSHNSERRRLYTRLDELRSADPALRRSRPRSLPLDPLRPLTIFSIEDVDDEGLREAAAL